MLFFLSPGCPSCKDAIRRAPGVAGGANAQVVLVVRANNLKTRVFVHDNLQVRDVPGVLVVADPDNRVADQYQVVAVPYTLVVDTHGRVAAKRSVITLSEIGNLLTQADRIQSAVRQEISMTLLATDRLETKS